MRSSDTDRWSSSLFSVLGLTTLIVLIGNRPIAADTLTFSLAEEYSGTAPAGSPPWLIASFSDLEPGSVKLTLDATKLVDNEFVSAWYFNLNPSLDPTELAFGPFSKSGAFDVIGVTTGTDFYKAGGVGYFDICFEFANAQAGRFGAGESLQVTITGSDTLTAESFISFCTSNGGTGPYCTAAHVQAIGPDKGSGWATDPVPEPSTMVLAGIGAILSIGYWRRRR
jgi:hypothetical protein